MNILKMLLFCFQAAVMANAAITYQFSCGRFGDNLLAYAHAKWISYNLKIPLIYRPFKYSDQLMMHQLETSFLSYKPEVMYLHDLTNIEPTKKTLYVVPYFSAFAHERNSSSDWNHFTMNWEDLEFHAELRRMMSPTQPITPTIPPGYVAVAIHVRKYEGALLSDQFTKNVNPKEYVDFKQLLKFPPEQFYIEQLQSVINLFAEQNLYVYIFSDENPATITQRFSNAINHSCNIIWDHRIDSIVGSDNHVLDDFFFMTKFPILIRPQSNFSFMAARFAQPIIEIFPVTGYWSRELEPVITKVQIIIRDSEKHSLLAKHMADLNKFVITATFRN